MRSIFFVAVVAVLFVAGCGSSNQSKKSTQQPPTATATKSFTDHTSGVSFRYPAAWQPHPGSAENLNGTKTYVIRIGVPGNAAGPEIAIVGANAPLPTFPNGQVRVDPHLGPGKYEYFHVTVAGRKGMQVEHILSSGLNEIHTFVEAGHNLYDVRIIAANPPLAGTLLSGYRSVITSLRIK